MDKFQPRDEESPTYRRFVEDPPKNAIVRKVNYSDNPYFPQVLKDELELTASGYGLKSLITFG